MRLHRGSALATVAVLAGLAFVHPASAAPENDTSAELRAAVTLAGVQAHQSALQTIADQNGGNRAAGTSGYAASTQYVADTLTAAGYVVTIHEFTYSSSFSVTKQEGREVTPVARNLAPITMIYSPSTPAAGIQVPIVHVPADADPGCQAADFAGQSFSGKIALIKRGTCTFALKASNARDAGALAALVYNNSTNANATINGTLSSSANATIPIAGITRAAGEALVADQAGGSQTVTVFLNIQTAGTATTRNILAETPGGDASEVVMAGGHLDSVTAGPGINDNGSGAATLLEVAEEMAGVAPVNKVRFAFWGAEELGLVGSTKYVNEYLAAADRANIAAYLNFDMVGSPNFARFIYDGDTGPAGSAQIEQVFVDYFSSQGLAAEQTALGGRSDHTPFANAGIPVGGLFTGAEGIKTAAQASVYGGTAGAAYDPCYHRACDTSSNVSTAVLDQMADATAHAVITYANPTAPPGAPTVTLTSTPPSSTASTSASFSWTTTGTVTSTTCSLDGGTPLACSSPQNYSGLADGGHSFRVTVSNSAGSNSASYGWTITTPPTVTLASTPPSSSTSTAASFSWTTTGTVTSTSCSLDGGAPAACSSPKSYSGLGDGGHTFQVTVSNAGGSNSASYAWTITTPPTVTLTSAPPSSTSSTNASFAWTTTGTVTNTACSLDGGAAVACSSPQNYSGLGEGSHSFQVNVSNSAGSSSASHGWTITTSAPATLTQISSDPFTNASSQHRTEVEPDTFAHGSTIVAAFQAGRFFNGGASAIGWATSLNGGASWTNGFLPGVTKYQGAGPYDRASDPAVAYDARHGVWLIQSLALMETPSLSAIAVLVSRSSDGGLTWDDPVTVASGGRPDKNWIVCDNSASSPFYGNCYSEWDNAGESSRIKMSTSSDGGLSWGPALNTGNNATGLGGQPVVQPNGQVIVPIANGSATAIRSFRSVDGGASWRSTVTISTVSRHVVAGGLRTIPLPSAEVDASGKVYVVWQDCRFRVSCSANDIVMATTTQSSYPTWSAVTRIPIDDTTSGIDHFIPGLAVDPTTSGAGGRLALAYYYYPAAACSVATCELNVGFVTSSNGGASWSATSQLAGPMSLSWLADTSQGRMVGDYISTSFAGGIPHPVFAVATAPTGATFDEAMYTVTSGGPAP